MKNATYQYPWRLVRLWILSGLLPILAIVLIAFPSLRSTTPGLLWIALSLAAWPLVAAAAPVVERSWPGFLAGSFVLCIGASGIASFVSALILGFLAALTEVDDVSWGVAAVFAGMFAQLIPAHVVILILPRIVVPRLRPGAFLASLPVASVRMAGLLVAFALTATTLVMLGAIVAVVG